MIFTVVVPQAVGSYACSYIVVSLCSSGMGSYTYMKDLLTNEMIIIGIHEGIFAKAQVI